MQQRGLGAQRVQLALPSGQWGPWSASCLPLARAVVVGWGGRGGGRQENCIRTCTKRAASQHCSRSPGSLLTEGIATNSRSVDTIPSPDSGTDAEGRCTVYGGAQSSDQLPTSGLAQVGPTMLNGASAVEGAVAHLP